MRYTLAQNSLDGVKTIYHRESVNLGNLDDLRRRKDFCVSLQM